MLKNHELLKDIFAIIGMLAIASSIIMSIHAYGCFKRYPNYEPEEQ